MDARRLTHALGVVLATSLSQAALAQYYPVMPMVVPSQMAPNQAMPVMHLQPIGPRGMIMRPGPSTVPSSAAWPAPSLPPGNHPSVVAPASPARQPGQAVVQSTNFVVFAKDPAWAQQVAETAESLRRELANHWLGRELPNWPRRCPIHVHDAADAGAGGETRFAIEMGIAGDWQMSVQGTRERILDSVLPHEISHTILATHFGKLNKYVPRWADEGAATTVEHEAEKQKHRHFLKEFLQTGRGLAFNKMFRLTEYPKDILPLYAQGHSAVQFLIDQSSPQEFVQFLEHGMRTENWQSALKKFYAYDSIWEFQENWNKWLRNGSPTDLLAYAPLLKTKNGSSVVTASAAVPSGAQNNSELSLKGNHRSNPLQVAAQGTGRMESDPRSLDLIPSHPQFDVATSHNGSATMQFDQVAGATPNSIPLQLVSESLDNDTGNNVRESTTTAQIASNDGWFKSRLRQTSGQPATNIPPHNQFAGERNSSNATVGARQSESTANLEPISTSRQPSAQSPRVQVLDWGNSNRISGPNGNTPLYR